MRLRDRVVVVTGGSAGVGRATALELARSGARVGIIARGEERLRQAVGEISRLGGVAKSFAADVADPAAIEEAAGFFERELGPIDVWINNAMVSVFSPVSETRAEEYRRVTEVTYLGYVHGTLAALGRMRPRNRGTIVQVGSALAYRSIPLQSAYCAAKHAVRGFTESLRTELLHDRSGVRVCQVHLPALNTPQFSWVRSRLPGKPQPVPPIFQPEVAARAIAWVARHPRRELWVGFPTAKAIVAEKFLAGFADRYLARHGVEAQQRPELAEAGRKDNLFEPVAGDFGSHGEFDARARKRSLEVELRMRLVPIALTVACGAVVARRILRATR
jgi:NAD(P)-dependent dehydrogenase (short-subunit alcohol dehydrogenase family)